MRFVIMEGIFLGLVIAMSGGVNLAKARLGGAGLIAP